MTVVGHNELPDEQSQALRKALRVEWMSIGYATITIIIVFFVLGNSQAMKTAWVEDILSTIPQFAFLVAYLFIRRPANRTHPYGYHRAMGVGHLVASVALIIVGSTLVVEAVSGLVAVEHPTIGTVRIFGTTLWLGWLMIGVMTVIVIPPFFFARAKMKLARTLHNKLLFADADMAKADWTTNVGSIVGVAGIGLGLWWADAGAALLISLSITWDGLKNTKAAVFDLMDERATTYDQKHRHPLIDEIDDYLRGMHWVADAGSRVRDEGHVFHIEAFVVPKRGRVTVDQIEQAEAGCAALDWKVQDIVIIPVNSLPLEVVGDD